MTSVMNISNNDCLDEEEMLAVAIKMTQEEDDDDAVQFPTEEDTRQERECEDEGSTEETVTSYTPVVNLDAEIADATELRNRQRCVYLQSREIKYWSKNLIK